MIAIVCCDAGGAEILSSWLNQNPQQYRLALEGPAVDIFKRKLGRIEIYSLKEVIESCDSVLCGTSWQSILEKQAIMQAKINGKRVVAFLDHWSNYRERFQFGSISNLPDEIWVGDTDAELIARKFFPSTMVNLVPNPYFKDVELELKNSLRAFNPHSKKTILYVCEPIKEHALLAYGNERYWGYTEDDALHYFFENINALGIEINEIKIRPHPSENKNKYDWIFKESTLVTEINSSKSLIQQIAEADIVVGCGSMAMVIGLLAKKRVISTIPPGGAACKLPQSNIEHLQMLVKN